METALRLLMRDGAVQIIFYPMLTAENYADLLRACKRANTRAELSKVVKELAAKWNVRCEVDEV